MENFKVGDPVSASDEFTGQVVEGNITALVYDDPQAPDGMIVIKDHESKELSHWLPHQVTKL